MDDKNNTGKAFHQADGKIWNSAQQGTDLNSNPYDSENLDNESDSDSKDITEQDIEKDLLNNDLSEGFETEVNSSVCSEFETIELDQDNPVNKEFEIGELSNEELKNDELNGDQINNDRSGSGKS